MRRQLLLAACGLAVLLAACSGGTPRQATPSATSTADIAQATATVVTPATGACPTDRAVCDFALQAEAALQRRDPWAFIAPASRFYNDSGPVAGIGSAMLHQLGTAAPPHLVSIACPMVAGTASCEKYFALGFDALAAGQERTPLPSSMAVIGFERGPGMPVLTGLNLGVAPDTVLKGGTTGTCGYAELLGTTCANGFQALFMPFGSNGHPLPDTSLGTEARPLQVVDDAKFPESTSLIVARGSGRGATISELDRYDRLGAGAVTKRVLSSPDDPGRSEITGVAASEDGTTLMLSLCMGEPCLQAGDMSAVTTRFERSTNGGVTWTKVAELPGWWAVRSMAGDAALAAEWGKGPPGWVVVPAGTPLPLPGEAVGAPLRYEGQTAWPAAKANLVDASGALVLSAPVASTDRNLTITGVLTNRGAGYAAAIDVPLGDLRRSASINTYIAVVESDGGNGRLKNFVRLDGTSASFGGWYQPLSQAVVSTGWQRKVACSGSEPAERSGIAPAILNLEAAKVALIADPFLCEGGEHTVVAVLNGHFYRVNTPGDCLNIRASPSPGGQVLECAADGVLLTPGSAQATSVDGREWLPVTSPDGRAGWASAEFLER